MISTIKDKVSGIKAHDPFGMLLVSRNWEEGSEYRYGFKTQKQDDEVYENVMALNDRKLNKYTIEFGELINDEK